MPPSSTIRRIGCSALIALIGVLGLLAVVTLAPLGAAAPDRDSSRTVSQRPNNEPDAVGVTQPRPMAAVAPLLVSPGGAVPLAAAALAAGAILLAAARAADGARLRRWRALLVGAPPVPS